MPPLQWEEGFAVCVILAAGGYPGSYRKGDVITGIDLAEKEGVMVFHAGTKLVDGQLLTDGGRVLGVTGKGNTLQQAIDLTYRAVAKIHFPDMYYRRDIGHRVLSR